MKRLLIFVVCCQFPTIAFAEPEDVWLYQAIKVENPHQLAYYVSADKVCPSNKEDYNNIVEAVLIRRRIKPLKEDIFVNGRIYLSIIIHCLTTRSPDIFIFNYSIAFGRFSPKPAVLFDSVFWWLGANNKENIEHKVKEGVEKAITAFVKVNFGI